MNVMLILMSCSVVYIQRNDETMFESDKALTITRHQEEMGKRLDDPSRKNIQQFLRIEGKTHVHESIRRLTYISKTSKH